LEELVEQLTWAQLGRHKKPILILNVAGFWDPLCVLLDHMKKLDFIRADLSINLLVAERVTEILPKLREAARAVSEREKEMTPIAAERM
ncbi:MAG TPA: LOG family protein, partial [Xanthobacteraceae bacterium]